MNELRQKRIDKIIKRIMELEQLERIDDKLIQDKHIQEYKELEQQLKDLDIEYINNGLYGDIQE